MANKLKTQADGREFAISLIEKCECAGDDASICPYDPEALEGDTVAPPILYRTGPQWDGVYRDLALLYSKGTEEARRGFCSILTDHLVYSGTYACDHREREHLGRNQNFGEPGEALRVRAMNPANAKLAEARADSRFQESMTSVVLNSLGKEQKKGAANE